MPMQFPIAGGLSSGPIFRTVLVGSKDKCLGFTVLLPPEQYMRVPMFPSPGIAKSKCQSSEILPPLVSWEFLNIFLGIYYYKEDLSKFWLVFLVVLLKRGVLYDPLCHQQRWNSSLSHVFPVCLMLLCEEERGLEVGVNMLITVLSEIPDFPRPAAMKEVVINFQMQDKNFNRVSRIVKLDFSNDILSSIKLKKRKKNPLQK